VTGCSLGLTAGADPTESLKSGPKFRGLTALAPRPPPPTALALPAGCCLRMAEVLTYLGDPASVKRLSFFIGC